MCDNRPDSLILPLCPPCPFMIQQCCTSQSSTMAYDSTYLRYQVISLYCCLACVYYSRNDIRTYNVHYRNKNGTYKRSAILQRLEFVAETRILAEMKIENRGKNVQLKQKSISILFFSTKIKVMDLSMQTESIKLIFIANFSVLDFFKFASRMPQIAKNLVSTFKIFRGR